MQRTLRREASLTGQGLFTGEKATMRLVPAPVGTGIRFQRVDLPGKPFIPAQLQYVKDTQRSTRLATDVASLQMVEHLLSALSAYDIDNVLVEIEGSEPPAGDGSAKPFVDLLEQAGFEALDAPRRYLRVTHPIYWSDKETHLIALPSDDFRISYTIHYPQSKLIGSQYYTCCVTREGYKNEIAPSRTFSLYEEIAPFLEKGFIKGGGLENALVIKDDRILNPGGARYADEMVRHKVLDLIGDLALLGRPLKAHILAVRSGHTSNIAFAKTLLNHFKEVEEQ